MRKQDRLTKTGRAEPKSLNAGAPGLLPDHSPTAYQPPASPVHSNPRNTFQIDLFLSCFITNTPGTITGELTSALICPRCFLFSGRPGLRIQITSHLIARLLKLHIYVASHSISISARLLSRASQVLHDLMAPANVSGHFPFPSGLWPRCSTSISWHRMVARSE